ncbi:Ger(x)C family spore germination protein [Ammoniphilus sp. YIM 78166]|uniref:Ger(x)C family spore germination protein n=1 Tax=Ammoniphilus sp. YIM 78166 TaxID=1644106 RepID=UPI00106F978E|nr:Ger(x)C family spore germination protein [Ammoniphilus sp. YIM 78166]
MKRSRLLLLLIVANVIFLSGCGFKDIDKRFFVVNIGIDKPDDDKQKYKVILKLAIPTGDIKSGDSEFILVEQEARTIADAVRIMKSRVDKEFDFSQAKVIVIGEKMLDQNMLDITDWMIRRRDIQKIAYMAAGVPDAKTILEIKPKSERLPSNSLFLTFGGEGSESIFTVTSFLFDFRRRLYEKGLDAFLPVIEQGGKDLFQINKLAMFNPDGFQGFLNPQDTKFFHPLLSSAFIRRTSVTVQEEDWEFVVDVGGIQAGFQVNEGEKGKVKILVNYEIQGIIEESTRNVESQELGKIGAIVEKEVEKKVRDMLSNLQKNEWDPAGFGLAYMAQRFDNEGEWEDWRERLYPNATFDIQVKADILGTGFTH